MFISASTATCFPFRYRFIRKVAVSEAVVEVKFRRLKTLSYMTTEPALIAPGIQASPSSRNSKVVEVKERYHQHKATAAPNFRRFAPVFFLHISQELSGHAAAFILKLFYMEKHCIPRVVTELAIANPSITQQVKAGLLRLQGAEVEKR